MYRRVAAILLLVASPLAPTVSAAADASPKSYVRDFGRLHDELREDKCRDALKPALALAGDPLFDVTISREGQISFLTVLTRCAFQQDDAASGFQAAELWVARDPKEIWPQVIRLHLGHAHEQPQSSLDALQVLAADAPAAIHRLELRDVFRLLQAAEKLDPSGTRKLEVYETLVRLGYEPQAPFSDDGLRMGHGRLLLERGRVDEARARLAGITDVESLVLMRVERLFDPLRTDPDFESRLELRAAVERDLARSRAAMDAYPALMRAVEMHILNLDTALRFDEALALSDGMLARLAADPKAYSDVDEMKNWVLNQRAYLLAELGRPAESTEMLREAANLLENGHPNVSNIINFGIHLVHDGRAAEALELLPRIGDASPYGKSWIESVRSCAGAQQGDEALRIQGLDYLKAHESDNQAALSRALLCSNDIDAAAALMIRRLGATETRRDALLALQWRPASLVDLRPYRKLLLERFDVLRAREDVRAAAEAVGRIEKIPVDVGGDI